MKPKNTALPVPMFPDIIVLPPSGIFLPNKLSKLLYPVSYLKL